MKCPFCETETNIIDSRKHEKGQLRRRECQDCLTRFNTFETIDLESLDKHLADRLRVSEKLDLTVRDYKEMRLGGMTDSQILKKLHYSPGYKELLQKWKKANGIKLGKGKTHLLDKEIVFEYLQDHSMLETAEHFGVSVNSLYRWIEVQECLVNAN